MSLPLSNNNGNPLSEQPLESEELERDNNHSNNNNVVQNDSSDDLQVIDDIVEVPQISPIIPIAPEDRLDNDQDGDIDNNNHDERVSQPANLAVLKPRSSDYNKVPTEVPLSSLRLLDHNVRSKNDEHVRTLHGMFKQD